MQRVSGVLSQLGKQQRRQANHPPPPSAESQEPHYHPTPYALVGTETTLPLQGELRRSGEFFTQPLKIAAPINVPTSAI
jgi:hypothetical protein